MIKSVWGEILADDMDKNYCCLTFDIGPNGELETIYAAFCGRSRSSELNEAIMKRCGCAAEVTAFDPFHPLYDEIMKEVDEAEKRKKETISD